VIADREARVARCGHDSEAQRPHHFSDATGGIYERTSLIHMRIAGSSEMYKT
jgi:hypothetical protein